MKKAISADTIVLIHTIIIAIDKPAQHVSSGVSSGQTSLRMTCCSRGTGSNRDAPPCGSACVSSGSPVWRMPLSSPDTVCVCVCVCVLKALLC